MEFPIFVAIAFIFILTVSVVLTSKQARKEEKERKTMRHEVQKRRNVSYSRHTNSDGIYDPMNPSGPLFMGGIMEGDSDTSGSEAIETSTTECSATTPRTTSAPSVADNTYSADSYSSSSSDSGSCDSGSDD